MKEPTDDPGTFRKYHPVWVTLPGLALIFVTLHLFCNGATWAFDKGPATLVTGILALMGMIWFLSATQPFHLYGLFGAGVSAWLAWESWQSTEKIGYGIVVLMIGLCVTKLIATPDEEDEEGEEGEEGAAADDQGKVAEGIQRAPAISTIPREPLLSFDDIEDPERVETQKLASVAPFEFPTMPHLLFFGPPGTGKSTLAKCLSYDLSKVYHHIAECAVETARDIDFITVTPSQLTDKKQLDELVLSIRQGSIVLLDEVHGIEQNIEESLYSVLQDGEYHLTDGGRHKVVKVPPCTFIGCTTLAGNVNDALRSRMIEIELEPVSEAMLVEIQKMKYRNDIPEPTSLREYKGQRNAKVLIIAHMMSLRAGYDLPEVVGITDEAAKTIAARSLGNPRMTKQILMHAEAWAASRKNVADQEATEVERCDVEQICKYLGIDNLGLTPADRRVIDALKRKEGKPLGKTTLASSARVSVSELEGMIEPKLLSQGIIEITPRGRLLSEYGEVLYADQE